MRALTWSVARLIVVAGAGLTLCTCTTFWQADLHELDDRAEADLDAPFIKAHLAGGEVVVLADWEIAEEERIIRGRGLYYDRDREVLEQGPLEVPFARILLLETNRPEEVAMHTAELVVMGVLIGSSTALTIVCAANPKTCFGSCPTLYADDGSGLSLRAEGFSGSVARILEETDLDALGPVRAIDGEVEVEIRNEALETHAIRSLELWGVRRPARGTVVRVDDVFYAASPLRSPISCAGASGDCLPALTGRDGDELRSLTDADDLAAREQLTLQFDARKMERPALVLTARNSLVNTFLFYHLLALQGRDAGEWVMRLERGEALPHRLLAELRAALGPIAVEVRTAADGAWRRVGAYAELGPIASDTWALPLPTPVPAAEQPLAVRLVLAKGYWRIDQVALTDLGAPQPVHRLAPARVLAAGVDSATALARLAADDRYLITYPGDAYRVRYRLPPGEPELELFTAARGYYVEWVREPWLAEASPATLAAIVADPRAFLRRAAPAFKRQEPEAEAAFWSSRVSVGNLPLGARRGRR